MASVVGTYARAFADVVMRQVLTMTPDGAKMKSHLDPDHPPGSEFRSRSHRSSEAAPFWRDPETVRAGIERSPGDRGRTSKQRAATDRPRKADARSRDHKNDREKKSPSALRTRPFVIWRSSRASRQHHLRRVGKRPVRKNSRAASGDIVLRDSYQGIALAMPKVRPDQWPLGQRETQPHRRRAKS